ncbi:hypothetical protein BGY98DRAFT_1029225 [Russula aff. rugulosa BPL654]|nr:hypothetical protein BGY98DRAFT_1029225 [Russula aff. rugulosa BPL654]
MTSRFWFRAASLCLNCAQVDNANGEDPKVYRAMLGVNEFKMTGMLKDWSVIPTLGAISCPTLVLNGGDDEVPDTCLFYGGELRHPWLEQPHGILGGASQRQCRRPGFGGTLVR